MCSPTAVKPDILYSYHYKTTAQTAEPGQKEPEQAAASRRSQDKTLVVEATAYTWTGNRTATGTWPKRGTVAVDPTIIPLGSKLWILGYG